jgi:hypothetical protein
VNQKTFINPGRLVSRVGLVGRPRAKKEALVPWNQKFFARFFSKKCLLLGQNELILKNCQPYAA